ncbi:hypothetical protein FXB40_34370 [Bradyrhizobium rifense]|uniref:Uncharacterized protein n=1 Tax=Bradyrhizobium rifense TaxID=515499 RepID=A0A5D3K7A4_9BRAD|nr:hypothetical protein FXB40_34370 [Bradyrhizobium rifense]
MIRFILAMSSSRFASGASQREPFIAVAAFLSISSPAELICPEVRADFQHLRRWRKSVEQAQSYTFKAVITVIATGLMGAVWLA